ncbi:MAG: hypothetical protein ACRC7O_08360 [Fimbriiglobus sp.]
MGTWSVSCGSCGHSWTLAGNWSVYEREAVESRPCPCCSAYTLKGGDKARPKKPRFTARRPIAEARSGALAG